MVVGCAVALRGLSTRPGAVQVPSAGDLASAARFVAKPGFESRRSPTPGIAARKANCRFSRGTAAGALCRPEVHSGSRRHHRLHRHSTDRVHRPIRAVRRAEPAQSAHPGPGAIGPGRRAPVPQLWCAAGAQGRGPLSRGRLRQLRVDRGRGRPECRDPAERHGARAHHAADSAGIERGLAGGPVRGRRVPGAHDRSRWTPYLWDEYVLFNPEQGWRYLSEYQGHWTDIAVIDEQPSGAVGRSTIHLRGRTFRHFQAASARTTFVRGEFPWLVRINETVRVNDYTSPPFVLSSEGTANEATWSLGTYVSGDALWRAFSVAGEPPPPVGVYVNQPSPFTDRVWRYWGMCALFAALLVVAALFRVTTSGRAVFDGRYVFDPSSPNPAFVTDPFTLDGRPSNISLSFDSNLSNNWMFLNLALINEETNTALDFGRELEYTSASRTANRGRRGRGAAVSSCRPCPPGATTFASSPKGIRPAEFRSATAFTCNATRPRGSSMASRWCCWHCRRCG